MKKLLNEHRTQLAFEENDEDYDLHEARILLRENQSKKYILAKPRKHSDSKPIKEELRQRMIQCLQSKENFVDA